MRLLALIAFLILGQPSSAAESLADGSVLAPGWKALSYPAAEPGTYELPSLGVAADGTVLDTAGRPHRLGEFLGDKVVVLSFVYMSCPDVNACPLATFVLTGVQRRILEDAAARDDVRLISLSFDPVLDRPEVMRRHARHIVPDGADWRFLTTDSQESLAPILTGYGQSVQREQGENGESLGTIARATWRSRHPACTMGRYPTCERWSSSATREGFRTRCWIRGSGPWTSTRRRSMRWSPSYSR